MMSLLLRFAFHWGIYYVACPVRFFEFAFRRFRARSPKQGRALTAMAASSVAYPVNRAGAFPEINGGHYESVFQGCRRICRVAHF
jgi:hypothetical protein